MTYNAEISSLLVAMVGMLQSTLYSIIQMPISHETSRA